MNFNYRIASLNWFGNVIKNSKGTQSISLIDQSITSFLQWSIVITVLLFAIGIWVLKRQIYAKYQLIYKANPQKQHKLIKIAGWITLIFMFLKSILLIISDYPDTWEILPLHFCRLCIMFFAFLMIFNKMNMIKYVAFASVLGALLALLIPDLKSTLVASEDQIIGDVNILKGENVMAYTWKQYLFYDFFITHAFSLLLPIILSVLFPYKITLKDNIYTYFGFVIVMIILFLINLIANSTGFKNWNSNYLYLGKIGLSGFPLIISKLGIWAWTIFTLLTVGIIYIVFASLFFIIQDKIHFHFKKNKFIFLSKSDKWITYKESFLNFRLFKKRK
ncbi:YwaF family protein [Mycoplasmopsis cricetuli]|uniref:YwaF family protein n=1 Tax=Mycoplasmopsis cricetuli TaxID=171283 RepID=UPI00046FCCDC|nr:YwaF family protein [Mycoplasmopsis cricetuli]